MESGKAGLKNAVAALLSRAVVILIEQIRGCP